MKVLIVLKRSTKTACLEKKLVRNFYGQKWLSANEVPVFLNCQYLIIRLISAFDFWNVDKYERKEQGLVTGFLKKLLFRKIDHFGHQNGASSYLWIGSKNFLKNFAQ